MTSNREIIQSVFFLFMYAIILASKYDAGALFNTTVNVVFTMFVLGLASKEIYDISKELYKVYKEKQNKKEVV